MSQHLFGRLSGPKLASTIGLTTTATTGHAKATLTYSMLSREREHGSECARTDLVTRRARSSRGKTSPRQNRFSSPIPLQHSNFGVRHLSVKNRVARPFCSFSAHSDFARDARCSSSLAPDSTLFSFRAVPAAELPDTPPHGRVRIPSEHDIWLSTCTDWLRWDRFRQPHPFLLLPTLEIVETHACAHAEHDRFDAPIVARYDPRVPLDFHTHLRPQAFRYRSSKT